MLIKELTVDNQPAAVLVICFLLMDISICLVEVGLMDSQLVPSSLFATFFTAALLVEMYSH